MILLFFITQVSDARQRPSGPSAKWLVPIVPCLQYSFAIKVQGQEEAIFELPKTVGPADPEAITKSGYVPEAPADFSVRFLNLFFMPNMGLNAVFLG